MISHTGVCRFLDGTTGIWRLLSLYVVVFTFEEQACISNFGFGCEGILSLKVRLKVQIKKIFSHFVLFVSIEG